MTTRAKPIMKANCPTCPFREDARQDQRELAESVKARIGFSASQICHHPVLAGSPETHLCRGARDWQLDLLCRMNFIKAPTDEAYAAACVAAGVEPPPEKVLA